MQLNAEKLVFEPSQFDLVIGGAIRHHLLAPHKAVAEAFRVLISGTVAVFFDPFELSNQVLVLVFQHLIDLNGGHSAGAQIEPATLPFLEAYCLDLRLARAVTSQRPIFSRWTTSGRSHDPMLSKRVTERGSGK